MIPDTLPRLDRRLAVPLHRQIYERYRRAIEQGLLAPGERIASARDLAAELGVARGTVEAAYARLNGEGYLRSRGQAGTVVADQVHLPPAAALPRAVPSPAPTLPTLAGNPLPFQLGIPALDAFPRKAWARLAARCLRATTPADLHYGDPAGHAPLRQAIAAYLLVSRGVACAPEQVFLTAGHRASLALAARVLLRRNEAVWIEDPGYAPAREVMQAAGGRTMPVPVDAQGLDVEQGIRKAAHARLAIVTPSHQAPLGVSLSLPRRLQLLQWAARARAWVIEDDYDGEYRYAGPPLPALKSLDTRDRVLYAGSFSKVLFPGLALSYLVVPASLAERFDAACRLEGNGPPRLVQAIVAAFMSEGHFSRHLKKMRLLYARRRVMLADALHTAFGDKVHIDLTAGGMHLIARFDRELGTDRVLATRAQAAGLMCQALSARSVRRNAPQGLLMGFTNIASSQEAARLARRLREALG